MRKRPRMNIHGRFFVSSRFLQQHHRRRFEHLLEGLQELRTCCTVHHAVIAGHRDVHYVSDNDLAVTDDGSRCRSANGDDQDGQGDDRSSVDEPHSDQPYDRRVSRESDVGQRPRR